MQSFLSSMSVNYTLNGKGYIETVTTLFDIKSLGDGTKVLFQAWNVKNQLVPY